MVPANRSNFGWSFKGGWSPKHKIIQIYKTMSLLLKRIPVLEPGVARETVQKLLLQVKNQKGLTSFIQKHGIHGRYLKEEEPLDISVSKMFRIMELKALYQTDDEFIKDWNDAGRKFLKWARRNKG